jgi:hypothetical protein
MTRAAIAFALVVALAVAAPGAAAAKPHSAKSPTRLWYRYEVDFTGTERDQFYEGTRQYDATYNTKWTLRSDDPLLLRRRHRDLRFVNQVESMDASGEITQYSGSADWHAWERYGDGCGPGHDTWRIGRGERIRFKGALASPSTSEDGLSLFVTAAAPETPALPIDQFLQGRECWLSSGERWRGEDRSSEVACCRPFGGANGLAQSMQSILGFSPDLPLGISIHELLRFKLPKGGFGRTFTISKDFKALGYTGEVRTYHYRITFEACLRRGLRLEGC